MARRSMRKTETGAGSALRTTPTSVPAAMPSHELGVRPTRNLNTARRTWEPPMRREARSVNRNFLDRRATLLRQRQHQHAVGILRLGLRLIDCMAKGEAPVPAPIVAFAAEGCFPLFPPSSFFNSAPIETSLPSIAT